MKKSVTVGLVIINVVVFLLIELTGPTENAQLMVRYGAMYTPYIQQNGEYWRLFTSLFLHFGIRHLLNNMLLLYVLGITLEDEIGKLKFLIVYLVSGIGANIVSYLLEVKKGEEIVSAGASGAVFAILGGMLWVLVLNHGHLKNYTLKNLIFMALLSLYFGFTSSGVDNAAHVAGLGFGFFVTLLVYHRRLSF